MVNDQGVLTIDHHLLDAANKSRHVGVGDQLSIHPKIVQKRFLNESTLVSYEPGWVFVVTGCYSGIGSGVLVS